MPTNILRKQSRATGAVTTHTVPADRRVALRIGRHVIRAELLATPTAERIWQQLPIFSVAETWGECIHFETPVETGRERTARLNVNVGDVCYWTEDDRVMIAFGPTPISRPNEIRLMRPCNVWARTIDDVSVLRSVTPGEKVAIERLPA